MVSPPCYWKVLLGPRQIKNCRICMTFNIHAHHVHSRKRSGLIHGNALCGHLASAMRSSFQCLSTSYCNSSLFPQHKMYSNDSQQIVWCVSRAVYFFHLFQVLSSDKHNFYQTLRCPVLCRDCLSCGSLLRLLPHTCRAGVTETLLPPKKRY